jgi:hypothetical protein
VLHRLTVVPLRRRAFSELSGCDTLSVYGFRAVCSCGWAGKIRSSMAVARLDLSEHRVDLNRA